MEPGLEVAEDGDAGAEAKFGPGGLSGFSAGDRGVDFLLAGAVEFGENLAGRGIQRGNFVVRDLEISCHQKVERASGVRASFHITARTAGGGCPHRTRTDEPQYSTSTRYSPLAGAVGPAAERARASRIRGMFSTGNVFFPARMKVPTRLRTM